MCQSRPHCEQAGSRIIWMLHANKPPPRIVSPKDIRYTLDMTAISNRILGCCCVLLIAACSKSESNAPPRSLSTVNSELDSLRKRRPTLKTPVSPLSSTPAAEAKHGDVASPSAQAKDDALAPPIKKPRRQRLPAPLRPNRPPVVEESDAPLPCTIVVSRVCSILTEGAEECAEARQQLLGIVDTEAQARCGSALAWYEKRFAEERRPRPCALLADVVCRQAGPSSIQCKRAKDEVPLLRKTMLHACKAGILMALATRG